MVTRRTSRWLFTALLMSVIVLPAMGGLAATDPALVVAARNDDLQTVRSLIAKRANVNEPARDGSTALLWATYHANLEMVRALIDASAPVNAPNHYGITPLLQASRAGDAALISTLLKGGADPAASHPDGETPLMAASRSGRLDAVKLLLAAGANANVADAFQQETALMWASAEGHADVVKALLSAGADPNRKARVTTIDERKHGDHATGGLTALMFAARNGHDEVVTALMKAGADPKATNGDGLTAMMIAIVNDRFDLAAKMLEMGADANDGSLYFAVDMHDATTDMRAHDGSRLRVDYPNTLTAMDLVRRLLDRGADPNKAFIGQMHNASLCCDPEINSSPFYRASVASDVEAMKLMIAHGAKVEWSPTEVKKETRAGAGAAAGGGGRGNPNVGKTPVMQAMVGGRGASFAAGPGFGRLGPPPFREASNREPLDAVKLLLSAGADPNAKGPDGSFPLHQAVQARQVEIIRSLVAAGAKLDAVNKDNLTPLLLAEKPEPPPPPGNNNDPDTYKPKRDSREEVIAALRDLMKLGPNDPAPVPPPLPKDDKKSDEKSADEQKVDNEKNDSQKDGSKPDEKKPGDQKPAAGSEKKDVAAVAGASQQGAQ
jgi:ankyrin repeat protein